MNRRGFFGCDDIIGESGHSPSQAFRLWISLKTGPLVLQEEVY